VKASHAAVSGTARRRLRDRLDEIEPHRGDHRRLGTGPKLRYRTQGHAVASSRKAEPDTIVFRGPSQLPESYGIPVGKASLLLLLPYSHPRPWDRAALPSLLGRGLARYCRGNQRPSSSAISASGCARDVHGKAKGCVVPTIPINKGRRPPTPSARSPLGFRLAPSPMPVPSDPQARGPDRLAAVPAVEVRRRGLQRSGG